MSVLFELPFLFRVNFCSVWLEILDQAKLDTAVCCTLWRAQYLEILKVLKNRIDFSSLSFARWAHLRDLKLTDLGRLKKGDAPVWNILSEMSLLLVKYVCLDGIPNPESVINYCKSLTNIESNSSINFNLLNRDILKQLKSVNIWAGNLTGLVNHCRGLTTLICRGCLALWTCRRMAYLFQSNRLEYVDLNADNQTISLVLKHCSETLTYLGTSGDVDYAMVCNALRVCPRLIKVMWGMDGYLSYEKSNHRLKILFPDVMRIRFNLQTLQMTLDADLLESIKICLNSIELVDVLIVLIYCRRLHFMYLDSSWLASNEEVCQLLMAVEVYRHCKTDEQLKFTYFGGDEIVSYEDGEFCGDLYTKLEPLLAQMRARSYYRQYLLCKSLIPIYSYTIMMVPFTCYSTLNTFIPRKFILLNKHLSDVGDTFFSVKVEGHHKTEI